MYLCIYVYQFIHLYHSREPSSPAPIEASERFLALGQVFRSHLRSKKEKATHHRLNHSCLHVRYCTRASLCESYLKVLYSYEVNATCKIALLRYLRKIRFQVLDSDLSAIYP